MARSPSRTASRPSADPAPPRWWHRAWPIGVFALATLIALPMLASLSSATIMDTVDVREYFVWLHQYARDQLRSGSVPLWNPYNYGGMPFAANPQASVFYPPAWLSCLLPVVSAQKLLVLLHVFMAGAFSYVFGRTVRLSRVAALIGALSYMLGGFMMTNVAVGHLTMLFTAAWLPLVLALWERWFQTGRLRWAGAAGLALAVQLTAGEPQCSYYTALLLTVYGIIRAGVDRESIGGGVFVRRLGLAVVGIAVVAVVSAAGAAIQLLPTAEMAAQSDRSAGTFEFATTMSMPWRSTIGFVIPWSEAALNGLAVERFKFAIPQNWEWACYTGLLTIVLAIASMGVRRIPVLVVARVVAGLAIVMMLGSFTPVYTVLLKVFPGLELFRIPPRASVMFIWAMSVMAAAGAERVLADAALRTTWRWWRCVSASLLGLLLLSVIGLVVGLDIKTIVFTLSEKPMTLGHPLIVPVLVAAATTLGLVIAMQWMPRAVVATAFVLVLGVDLLISRPAVPLATFDRENDPNLVFLASIKDQTQSGVIPFRVDTSRRTHFSNAAMVGGVELMNGYMPFSIGRFFTFVHRMRGLDVPGEFRSYVDDDVYRASPEAFPLRIMNVRIAPQGQGTNHGFVQHSDPIPRAWIVHRAEVTNDPEATLARLRDPAFDPRGTVLLEATPRTALDGGPPAGACVVTRLGAAALRIETRSDRDGYLVLSEMHYPGWEATIDGEPIATERANYLITAVPLPAGSHTVDYRYRPASVRLGAMITLLTVLGATGTGGVLAFRRRAGRTGPDPAE